MQGHAGARLDLELRVARDKRKASRKQRGYYHPVVCEMWAEFSGLGIRAAGRKAAHEAFKSHILGLVEGPNGLRVVRSTKSLNPAEFVIYVEECVRLAAEMGCVIPPPDPHWRVHGYLEELAEMRS